MDAREPQATTTVSLKCTKGSALTAVAFAVTPVLWICIGNQFRDKNNYFLIIMIKVIKFIDLTKLVS